MPKRIREPVGTLVRERTVKTAWDKLVETVEQVLIAIGALTVIAAVITVVVWIN
ncbi:MAG: hypothetical protein AAF636_19720 [Pseudomonadota bacterium]